ncbi:DNA polymerase III subunit gamma/tau [Endozoicomonas sp. G2_1]|uniref:DNA polymerase III subunit gamma/tau n=1 Tax=Endozoicomonas sp. G2_1 TaxID=2821091 RepID=UPI001ADCD7DB|nr:DNA polymerase III subunit gamma/tau [Endozoicomonas sp. G2_1]MBO9488859.1 DNA polymerase III subunit gamma/tau [Endozoicomonas sp. G2_1]
MSYQVLARKWRPKSFQELMGQEHVVNVLTNALAQQRLHHAYLFTGTRGVGKTTIARIFAKSLNCQQGVSATPCGQCDICQDIDQSRFIDLLEIDAASRTKVDDTREILDNVQYAPSRGRYKVYLIDEVHMLSRSSFNALLKTLEEPPEHVKFILATTDPQKLPVTVLSRCLQFHLKALTTSQIKQQLEIILPQEQVTFDDTSLLLLAKAAKGSMRDCLSLTDQAIAQGQGQLIADNIQQMLGGVDQNWSFNILLALVKQDSQGLMALSQQIASYAPNYHRLLADLIQLLHQVALAQIIEHSFDLLPEQEKLFTSFCRALSPEDVQLYYQIALNGRKDMPYAADEQAAFDMVLLRMLAFEPMTHSNRQRQTAQTENSADNSKVQANAKPEVTDDLTELSPIGSSVSNSSSVSEHNRADQNTGEKSVAGPNIEDIKHSAQDLTAQQPAENQPEHVVEQDSAIVERQEQQHQEVLAQELAAIEQTAASMIQNDNLSSTSVGDNSELLDTQQTAAQNSVAQEPLMLASSVQETDVESNASIASNIRQQSSVSDVQDNDVSSPVEQILASRNMLRSRKKQLEQQQTKKPSGAAAPTQQTVNVDTPQTPQSIDEQNGATVEPTPEPINIAEIPEQVYHPEIIDPAKIRNANQIDKWASMIDAMALNGRIRQLAIHATISANSTDDQLVLSLDQSTKHLQSEAAHQQLEQAICQYLNRPITVVINVVEQTIADPYQIQNDINDKRYQYAKQVLEQDDIVVAFQRDFQAELDPETIKAL